jgi:hypothetical protein
MMPHEVSAKSAFWADANCPTLEINIDLSGEPANLD